MPLRGSIWYATSRHRSIIYAIDCCFSLDVGVMCGVNIFTLIRTLGAEGAGEARQQARKDRCSPRTGHAQSGAREGARSKVSGKRVLRSARRRAGQIRDAASCLHRQRLGDRGVRRVWLFQADLLPGQGELRCCGDCGIGPKEARSPRPPQGPRRGPCVPAGTAGPRRAGSR